VDAASHQVDVILPSELMAVRMRMLRQYNGKRYATVADQVGGRATIVAPTVDDEDKDERRAPVPTLLSLVITQRSPVSWYGGAWIALLTGIAILVTALWWLPKDASSSTDAITILIVAPTLVAAVLSVRAGNDIAEQLTKSLRRLIAAVGVLAAACSVGLVAQQVAARGRPSVPHSDLKWVWIAAALLLLSIALALVVGALRMWRLISFGRARRPRNVEEPCPGTVLNRKDGRWSAPRIPPPDRWLDADEGELVPWAGCTTFQASQMGHTHPPQIGASGETRNTRISSNVCNAMSSTTPRASVSPLLLGSIRPGRAVRLLHSGRRASPWARWAGSPSTATAGQDHGPLLRDGSGCRAELDAAIAPDDERLAQPTGSPLLH
jgi:hypothetical protein